MATEQAEFTRIEIEEVSTRVVSYRRGGKQLSGESVVVKTSDGETISLAPWEEGYADSRKALLTKKPCDVVLEQKGEYQNIKVAKVSGVATKAPVSEGEDATPLPARTTDHIPDRTRQILIIRQSCLKAAVDLMALPNFPPERLEGGEQGEFKSEEQLAVEIARYFEETYILAGVKDKKP